MNAVFIVNCLLSFCQLFLECAEFLESVSFVLQLA